MVDSMDAIPLSFREAASGILGSVSLTCWIFLLVPQLIENYRCGSADAISIPFILIWFAGDLTNFVGAAWAHLVPTIIAIAIYFCIADGVLISQCLYYNVMNARREKRKRSSATTTSNRTQSDRGDDPTQPLLERHTSNIGLPGSRRRSSASLRRRSTNMEPPNALSKILEEDSVGKTWMKNVVSVAGICVVGCAGWAIAWRTGVWRPTPESDDTGTSMAVGAQILGYFSAVCYLGARIPQIIKNWREKSCEGLSLLFFILSLLGNVTYGGGIVFHSTEKEYFLTNLPWLIGSFGTMFEDITIFVQFHIYKEGGRLEAETAVA